METLYSEEQKLVIEAPATERTIVMSAAASGKTKTATGRIIHLLESGIDPSKIVMITFTNNAAAEMASRIPAKFREGGLLFVGTMHSYVNHLLMKNGFDTSPLIEQEEFDELLSMVYENPQIIEPLDYLIVDEVQDLNSAQFTFLDILDPVGFLYIGDVRQSIYGFSGASPQSLLYRMNEGDVVVRELTQNYRNAKTILKRAEDIVQKMNGISLRETIPMREIAGTVRIIQPNQILPNIKLAGPDYSGWAVLCRSNRNVDIILARLKREGIPAITFRQAQGDLQNLRENMSENAVKVLTIHSAKGLEFDNVIIYDFSKGKSQETHRLNYVAVTRAKDILYIVNK